MKVNGYEIKPRANLYRANLSGADLYRANLYGANLSGVNLSKANLSGANLSDADLSDADLSRANLSDVDLFGADLSDADLSDADLSRANLSWANLSDADLSDAKLPHFQIVPEEGEFIAYKKTTKGVVKLLIPSHAKRTSSIVGRKCRASHAIVLEGFEGATGTHYQGIEYKTGAEIHVPDYNNDTRVECAPGIHFFITKREAEEWV